jgi:hypothetical protein
MEEKVDVFAVEALEAVQDVLIRQLVDQLKGHSSTENHVSAFDELLFDVLP